MTTCVCYYDLAIVFPGRMWLFDVCRPVQASPAELCSMSKTGSVCHTADGDVFGKCRDDEKEIDQVHTDMHLIAHEAGSHPSSPTSVKRLKQRPRRRSSKLHEQIDALVPKTSRRVCEEGRFWIVEGLRDESIQLKGYGLKHTILFRDCHNAQLHLKKKCNGVQMCKALIS